MSHYLCSTVGAHSGCRWPPYSHPIVCLLKCFGYTAPYFSVLGIYKSHFTSLTVQNNPYLSYAASVQPIRHSLSKISSLPPPFKPSLLWPLTKFEQHVGGASQLDLCQRWPDLGHRLSLTSKRDKNRCLGQSHLMCLTWASSTVTICVCMKKTVYSIESACS